MVFDVFLIFAKRSMVGTFFCTLLPDILIFITFKDRDPISNKLHALIQFNNLDFNSNNVLALCMKVRLSSAWNAPHTPTPDR